MVSAATSAAADLAAPAMTPGTYLVTYHVVARDGHPTSGEYRFVVRGQVELRRHRGASRHRDRWCGPKLQAMSEKP